jgi:hypothetical protein
MRNALPCIVCDKKLKSLYGPNQPDNGLEFTTQGHYGTTVFDPMDGSYLAINVCDDCLKKAISKKKTKEYPPRLF